MQISTSIAPSVADRLAEIVDAETARIRAETGDRRRRIPEAEITRRAIEAFVTGWDGGTA